MASTGANSRRPGGMGRARMELTVNGVRVRYSIEGPDGAPWLLCLHSLATDSSVWTGQLDRLTEGFRVVCFNLRGHGGSEATPPPYSLDLLVADAVGVLDALQIDRAHVMGLSIGAMITLGMGIEHPSRVQQLIVASGRADAPEAYVDMWDNAIATIGESGLEPVVDQLLQRWFTPAFRESESTIVERLRAVALGTSIDGFVGCARA